MLFSIIVPVYNVAEYLPRCMDSLFAQEGEDYEILLVDDGSTDGASPRLCDEYAAARPGRVRVIHQENGGLGAARNTGIAAARGEYVLCVDSDDWIAGNTLAALREQIAATGADMYCFSFQYARDGGALQPAEPPFAPPDGRLHSLADTPALLLNSPSACLRLCRRSLYEGIEFPGRVWYEDLRTTPKLLLAAKTVALLPDAFYFYYMREGSIMHSANLRRNLEILDALESVRCFFAGQEAQYRDWLCFLALENSLQAARRVLMEEPKADYLPRFLGYVREHWPDYRKNPLLPRLGKKKLALLKLLEGEHYGLARRMFLLAGKLK